MWSLISFSLIEIIDASIQTFTSLKFSSIFMFIYFNKENSNKILRSENLSLKLRLKMLWMQIFVAILHLFRKINFPDENTVSSRCEMFQTIFVIFLNRFNLIFHAKYFLFVDSIEIPFISRSNQCIYFFVFFQVLYMIMISWFKHKHVFIEKKNSFA